MSTTRVSMECPSCGIFTAIPVPTDGLIKWKNTNAHIQDVLPTLSAMERETLLTGMCAPCWDAMVAELEDVS